MLVMKFGGSSVANATNISRVLDLVIKAARKEKVVLVSSAIKGCTDSLIEIGKLAFRQDRQWTVVLENIRKAHHGIITRLFTGAERSEAIAEIDKEIGQIEVLANKISRLVSEGNPTGEYIPPIESYGEVLSTKLLSLKLACEGFNVEWLDSRSIIRTETAGISQSEDGISHTSPKVIPHLTKAYIASAVQSHPSVDVFVAPGFIASDAEGNIVTLGRGGSDYSAALYAVGAGAEGLQIWTDVPGIMTANPKDVPSARTVPEISYKAALQLAEHGAKVLYAPTVQPVMEAGIPFSILNSFDPANPGTVVGQNKADGWCGVTSMAIAAEPGLVELCLVRENGLVRESSRTHKSGTAGSRSLQRMLTILKENGIRAIDSRIEDNGCMLFVTVHKTEEKAALAAVHRDFFEERKLKEVRVFIAGTGAVGRELIRMIGESAEKLADRSGKSIRIVGLSNSSRFVIDPAGVPTEALADPAAFLNGSKAALSADGGAFFKSVAECGGRGSVLVDCTNSEDSGKYYVSLFEAGVGVVTSNRRAISGPYSEYAGMKAAAHENGVIFRYDTTVGAALPILESIGSGANSCDRILTIRALLSCTMNHIITGYDGANTENFATLLKKAQDAGLTEKDPRMDLGGRDVLRKILIVGREAGIPLEESDVEVIPMLGPEYFDCSLEEFYLKLARNEQKFIDREKELDDMNMRQRFIASIEKDASKSLGYRISVKMCLVSEDSQFYWVKGTENVMMVTSEYISSPLVLKGDGEGAKLAAGGILNDLIR